MKLNIEQIKNYIKELKERIDNSYYIVDSLNYWDLHEDYSSLIEELNDEEIKLLMIIYHAFMYNLFYKINEKNDYYLISQFNDYFLHIFEQILISLSGLRTNIYNELNEYKIENKEDYNSLKSIYERLNDFIYERDIDSYLSKIETKLNDYLIKDKEIKELKYKPKDKLYVLDKYSPNYYVVEVIGYDHDNDLYYVMLYGERDYKIYKYEEIDLFSNKEELLEYAINNIDYNKILINKINKI